MRILVTGHKGYIGAIMVPMLIEAGHEVLGLDSDLFGGCAFMPGVQEVPEIKLDIRDVQRVHLEGLDAVVHLAALANDALSNLNPKVTEEINYTASVRLAQLAKDAGISRFLFSSSCSVYGKAGDALVDEDAKLDPITPYTISKFSVEQELAKLADETFSPTFLRNATAYGVSPSMDFDLVLNNLVAWAYTKGYVFIKSDGSPWRPTVHIEDISRAFLAVLTAPREIVHNQAFNVGRTDENYRVRELAEIVRDVIPSARIEYMEGGRPDARSYRVNFDKIQHALPSFKPQWNVRRGVEQLYDTYRNTGFALEDFEGPRFKRVAHVKYLLSTGKLDNTLRWK